MFQQRHTCLRTQRSYHIFSNAQTYYMVSESGWKENHLWWTGSLQTCRRPGENFSSTHSWILVSPSTVKRTRKCSYLLLWVRDKGKDIVNSWIFLLMTVRKGSLSDHFKNDMQPKINPAFVRFKFNNLVQGNTTFDQVCH